MFILVLCKQFEMEVCLSAGFDVYAGDAGGNEEL